MEVDTFGEVLGADNDLVGLNFIGDFRVDKLKIGWLSEDLDEGIGFAIAL